MLKASSLSVGYEKGLTLIDDINFHLAGGQMALLLGLNGIGKSTMLRTLCGLMPPLAGSILYNNSSIFEMTYEARARVISGVFANREIDPYLRVRELVALGRYPSTNWLGRLNEKDEQLVEESLEKLGLLDLAHKELNRLSDGERQKAFIAKSLAQNTPIIILDEPTAFLDYKNKATLFQTLAVLSAEAGKILLISTHDIGTALPFCRKLLLITEKKEFVELAAKDIAEEDLKDILDGRKSQHQHS